MAGSIVQLNYLKLAVNMVYRSAPDLLLIASARSRHIRWQGKHEKHQIDHLNYRVASESQLQFHIAVDYPTSD